MIKLEIGDQGVVLNLKKEKQKLKTMKMEILVPTVKEKKEMMIGRRMVGQVQPSLILLQPIQNTGKNQYRIIIDLS